jgi:hypothetical protein
MLATFKIEVAPWTRLSLTSIKRKKKEGSLSEISVKARMKGEGAT